ncbi:hypothetical protein MSC49_03230 [Methylosinus sp. C49]|uniref:hypothetical protein n=1 Tax=Methylosinus sp. C49 TaxID=2699395 RepID=UPI001367657E|nr:hypothetical protein [Methylosinus sp. C49]BBU60388.1 hypothetical protein MSC49_03230 [Methylosinus sp. C49]
MLEDLVSNALADFREVARLAQVDASLGQINPQILPKPHKARTLPVGNMAIYAFFLEGRALKVGKVGPNSGPRFTYQHYTGAAQSTLHRSILANREKVGAVGIDAETAADWIRNHTDRIDLLIPASFGLAFLSLLEAFLQARWKPLFEGKPDGD